MEISLFTMLFVVFVLACFVGYHVIWGVTPALHTPLMAVTNAISGIVIVAAIVVAGSDYEITAFCKDAAACAEVDILNQQLNMAQIIGFLAVTLASINIFGGFAITRRMLAMFKKKEN